MKITLAAVLLAAAALTNAAFADDAAPLPPSPATQAWQQISLEQKQAMRAEHREAALAKKETRSQMSPEEKAAMQQKMHRQMEMRHEQHQHRREIGHRMGR
ncbi:hypothetical protein EDC61_101231 [Sulfuritortus calidifontis]|uniref:LTXXQ motif family protein n=2 Tax=Sulfuritortus calidifontis TaxID=1914471 RepID=A0A4R3JYZ2_9PROT|nr:hypothetical protein EDC61_101231 [Sulfuritortus calidifontis]